MFKTALFDLDGTLTDSGDGIMACGRIAVRALGYPEPDEAKLRIMRGPALIWSFTTLFGMPRADALKAIEIYRENYPACGMPLGRVFPGALDMLDRLRAAGVRTYVVTAKYQVQGRLACDYFGLSAHVDGVYGSGDPEKANDKAHTIRRILKTEAFPTPAVMVGDKDIDIAAGRACSLSTIGVTYGYGAPEEFGDADFVCGSIEDVLETILKQG